MGKALQTIEEMTRLGITRSYAVGGGIAARLAERLRGIEKGFREE